MDTSEARRAPRTGRDRLPTVGERAARGKGARAAVPRSSHAVFQPGAGRLDPVDLLEVQAQTRVRELVPIRYGRMLVSPFAFYRGAALVMASDLAPAPRSGLRTQLCGDAHASNFGVFASPERRLVFDINDFDETHPGPWEWDVKRLAASLAVAAREDGFAADQQRTIVLDTIRAYREAMQAFASMGTLEVWYARLDVDDVLARHRAAADARKLKKLERNLEKARTRDNMQAFSRLTHLVDGERRIVSDRPLVIPIEELVDESLRDRLEATICAIVRSYRHSLASDRRALLDQFRFVHVAFKVVGVGSVGTRAWIVLLLGRDNGDPLFLQVKQAQASVLERFVGKSVYRNAGQRVVAGQRLMQAASDIFLGWHRATGLDGEQRDFYVRQLRDWKGSIEMGAMLPSGMALYGQVCGWTLARAHARSGDRVALAAYLGKSDVFDRAIADFSQRYADQNERDYDALAAAAKTGRVAVERDR